MKRLALCTLLALVAACGETATEPAAPELPVAFAPNDNAADAAFGFTVNASILDKAYVQNEGGCASAAGVATGYHKTISASGKATLMCRGFSFPNPNGPDGPAYKLDGFDCGVSSPPTGQFFVTTDSKFVWSAGGAWTLRCQVDVG